MELCNPRFKKSSKYNSIVHLIKNLFTEVAFIFVKIFTCRFSEPKEFIEVNQEKLIAVFNKNFPWLFNIDQIMIDETEVGVKNIIN